MGGCRFDSADCREEVRVERLSIGVGNVRVKFVVRLATGTWISRCMTYSLNDYM